MGNKHVSTLNINSFLVERILCVEPVIKIGIFLCEDTHKERQGIQVDNDNIYGFTHMKEYYDVLNYFFDEHIRLTISNSNKLSLILVYKEELIIKDISKSIQTDYKPFLFGESKELDKIYSLIINGK